MPMLKKKIYQVKLERESLKIMNVGYYIIVGSIIFTFSKIITS